MRKLFLLLVLLPVVAWAQTFDTDPATSQTYHMPYGKVFICNAASSYPINSFDQFECRGIPLADTAGKIVGSFYLFSPNELTLDLPGFVGNPYKSHTVNPKKLTSPNYAFNFFAEDLNGRKLNGVAHLTWKNYHICGGRGCQWWAPELTAFSITVD